MYGSLKNQSVLCRFGGHYSVNHQNGRKIITYVTPLQALYLIMLFKQQTQS